MDSLRLYFKSCRMLMRSQMQYRASFLLSTVTQLTLLGSELCAVFLLLGRFTRLGHWSAGEILFFFGMTMTAFYCCEAFFRGVTDFQLLIGRGDLDTLLLRPRGVLFQVFCSQADPRRFGGIAVGLLSLILGAISARVRFTALRFLLLLWSLLGGIALILGLFLIEATLCFFSVKSIEMVNVLTYGGRSACQYPVDLYPRPLQLLFTLIAPFSLTLQLPAAYLLGHPLPHGGALAAAAAPVSGFVFLLLMAALFYRGLRHYRSTGS